MEVRAGDRIITERSLQQHRRDIEDRFLVRLPGYGMVVLRANKQPLENAVDQLSNDVAAYSKGVKSQLEKLLKESQASIIEALLPAVERNPPDAYTKTLGPNPSKNLLQDRLSDDIARAFDTANALVSEMKVKLMFKDVAYESLVDGKFFATARKAMPDLEFLHDEFQATPARAEA
jgi:hypothetical protein